MARICREAGSRVHTNMMVRDMDVQAPLADSRRLEVIVDGLPVRGGAQVPHGLHFAPRRRGAADRNGVALQIARRRKEITYPEFFEPGRRAHLVVVAIEVGGRWSEETRGFLSALAIARARREIPLMRKRARPGG